MFDIGFLEILFLATIALIVIGPEKLPHAARLAGGFIGMAKRHMHDFKSQIEHEIHAKELEERIKQEMEKKQALLAKLNEKVSLTDDEAGDAHPPHDNNDNLEQDTTSSQQDSQKTKPQ